MRNKGDIAQAKLVLVTIRRRGRGRFLDGICLAVEFLVLARFLWEEEIVGLKSIRTTNPEETIIVLIRLLVRPRAWKPPIFLGALLH